MINPMSLDGRTIIITGASDGIGRSTAILCSQLNAKVILISRNEDKLKLVINELEGNYHSYYPFDLTDLNEIENLVVKIVREHGPIDGLVHSAGIATIRPLNMTNYDFINDMFLINFYSFVELTKSISKKGRFSNNLSIVAMSSISSLEGLKAKLSYSSSKAALDAAVRSMARELGDKNIRVNSIVAGFVKTKMLDDFIRKVGNETANKRFENYILDFCEPIDIAYSIAFLLSSASSKITGIGLVVDSGKLV